MMLEVEKKILVETSYVRMIDLLLMLSLAIRKVAGAAHIISTNDS